jgi:hypothetical protein
MWPATSPSAWKFAVLPLLVLAIAARGTTARPADPAALASPPAQVASPALATGGVCTSRPAAPAAPAHSAAWLRAFAEDGCHDAAATR